MGAFFSPLCFLFRVFNDRAYFRKVKVAFY
jgi:hypothetical protein